jgi:hypothetical protein
MSRYTLPAGVPRVWYPVTPAVGRAGGLPIRIEHIDDLELLDFGAAFLEGGEVGAAWFALGGEWDGRRVPQTDVALSVDGGAALLDYRRGEETADRRLSPSGLNQVLSLQGTRIHMTL